MCRCRRLYLQISASALPEPSPAYFPRNANVANLCSAVDNQGSRNRYQSPVLEQFRDGHRRAALACCQFVLILGSCVNGAAQSDQVVANHQKALYEAWLNRPLRGHELRQVTDEFIVMYRKRGKDRGGMQEIARSFEPYQLMK